MRLLDLADACRKSGLKVVEQSGWKTRGHGEMVDVRSITCHHTAGPATGECPSLGYIQNNSLSQLVLGRSGTVYVVAAGLCYHAGVVAESWQGNAYAIGIEAEATGVDPWPDAQWVAYVKLCRALADHYRVPYARVLGHKEVAVFPAGHARAGELGRKIDPNFNMVAFRAALNAPQEDPEMWTDIVTNMNGDQVQAIQVLNGVEVRTADAQNRMGNVEDKINTLTEKVDGLALTGGQVDLDALAAKVADLLAARLAS